MDNQKQQTGKFVAKFIDNEDPGSPHMAEYLGRVHGETSPEWGFTGGKNATRFDTAQQADIEAHELLQLRDKNNRNDNYEVRVIDSSKASTYVGFGEVTRTQ